MGAGLVTLKLIELDGPPPGDGLVTTTAGVPAAARSAAVTGIVSCVELTKVVVRAVPAKLATDVLVKFVPFTVSVKPGEPTAADAGCSDVTVGAGFLPVMARETAFETPPPGTGLVTTMLAVLAVSISWARIAAVTWVALT